MQKKTIVQAMKGEEAEVDEYKLVTGSTESERSRLIMRPP